MTREEEEEVRSLLSRHQERIMLDLGSTDLLAVLVKNSVLSQSEEDLLLKPYAAAALPVSTQEPPGSAPSSVGALTKRKLSAVASSGSSTSASGSGSGTGGEYSAGSLAGSGSSRCASVNGDAQSDNRSLTPSVGGGGGACVGLNDAEILRLQCANLIEIIAKNGFEKFKQFCYAIECECPQLIEDLINDRLKSDAANAEAAENSTGEGKLQKEIESIDYIDKEKENDRNRRAVSYGGGDMPSSVQSATIPRAAPRRVALMKEPPPPPPPKPQLSSKASLQSTDSSSTCLASSKYPQSEYNLIQKIDSNSTLTAPAQYQPQNFYANTGTIASSNGYGSLLCHASSTASPLAVRKRDKLLHRFSDAATLGRKLKKKKNTNRTCRSMTEAIEMLADPVIEDEFFGDRTTWEYHTVSVTRVPGYGFGIAVSGGRDNPHFANGDPSIAVSDVLKGGPAEDRLQVNDRIISVNGVSLENVEYATAVQVLRDSGNTVTLVVKRRVPLNTVNAGLPGGVQHQHQHSHSLSSMGQMVANGNGGGVLPGGVGQPSGAVMSSLSQPNSLNSSLVQNASGGQPIKVTLTKGNKKDDYGVVLGCRLFVKEISSKAREQLNANGYSLQEGDIITRIHNTNCGDTMSLKEAKKIIDGCKERLNLVVLRDITNQAAVSQMNLNNSGHHQQSSSNLYASHQAQVSGCSNNLEDAYLPGGASYSSQNLYVQPPTRTSNGPSLNGNGLNEEKSNLTPRGRSRGPLMDGVSLQQLDRPVSPTNGGRGRSGVEEPPRPPPPRGTSGGAAQEDFYSSRRQLYEERQSAEPRFISFQKEGSVGIRLTGGNEAGIFVTAVQPGSPASLQGLMPGDKILKVNDMDMNGVTREEAVLFLLSLQDRIDLIVQYCKEEYDEVVTNQRGDSFHIKTHFHCDNPSKGEMAFKAGDVFRVIDTLHNGVVGSWQVLKIGRGHQEMQRGVIPNKSRAEELATAQFNATKKEMNANESRGNFFRRRRSTHRRSKSLSRENWDDVVFSDSISKFPAYERVVLRHPGFVRPVVLFGPVSDLARERLAKDFPDKFSTPLQDDDKSAASGKCRIVRLSNIRDVMDRGKHALLDITPNAVDRLNYAQFYPVVIFLKTDSKHVIKQLRHGLPKAAHKSSKKLLEQCQKLERVWSHIFSTQIVLNDEESWYRKLRDSIDLQQSGAVWMSESKFPDSPTEMLFPPYIAQPCKFACCRASTSISTSVPRYSQNAIRRSSPSSFSQSYSQSQSQCQTPPPPRPPAVGFEPTRVYQGQHSQSLAEKPLSRKSYTMVPIIKPASSMPSGLAAAHPAAPIVNSGSLMQVEGKPLDGDTAGSQYHSSQPNLLSNSFATPKHDYHRSSSNMNLHLNGSGGSGSTAQSKGFAPSSTPAPAPTPVSRYGLRPGAVIERRTTPYYYHELLQKNVFDSSLNLLEKNKNSNLKLEQPSSVPDSHVVVGKRAPMAKPQQRLLSGNPRSSYGGGGCYPSSSSSVSNLLGNGNGNDEGGSDGTLVDDDDIGGGEDARNFSLAFNNLTNQIASLNNSSSSSNHNNNQNNQNNNNSNSNNINNYNNNNNSAHNNADSNNNVGQSNECIA
ncbi:tight junction protein ZO-2 isoform X6 [Drosophila persimilis]|uniref:tight junction protein ZO-2 isoform X6 n=1 Tax=Drosophila persimilis TaxID=7234 RepID=UPI000F098EEC|nr:tight junction protein ZO-2 isoform X6 [Drosophila persimilis]